MSVRDCDDLFAGLGSNRISANSGLSVAKRIMVVEDNDLNRKLFCDVLKANGFEVDPVADGHSVLEAARTTAPDASIRDNASVIQLRLGMICSKTFGRKKQAFSCRRCIKCRIFATANALKRMRQRHQNADPQHQGWLANGL